MNYIYDITLNLKENLYNFYEWKEEDYPEFVLKIPIFKIDEDAFIELKNNNIKINSSILKIIKNQTEVYSPNKVITKKYISLFACDEEVIAIEFDDNGYSIKKSTLSIDEEEEVLDVITLIKMSMIDYKICSKSNLKTIFKTRNEKELMNKLENELNNLMNNKNYDALKYVFYEIYKEKSDNYDKIYIKLLNIIKNSDIRSKKIDEIFNIINDRKITS